jgi:hypothetical protein
MHSDTQRSDWVLKMNQDVALGLSKCTRTNQKNPSSKYKTKKRENSAEMLQASNFPHEYSFLDECDSLI